MFFPSLPFVVVFIRVIPTDIRKNLLRFLVVLSIELLFLSQFDELGEVAEGRHRVQHVFLQRWQNVTLASSFWQLESRDLLISLFVLRRR